MSNEQKIYATVGSTFSGKSTLSKHLAEKLGLTRLAIDGVREEIGKSPLKKKEEDWNKAFNILHQRLKDAIDSGESVIVDAPHHKRKYRKNIRQIAKDKNCELTFIWLKIGQEELLRRWKENQEKQNRHHPSKQTVIGMLSRLEPPTEVDNCIVYTEEDDLGDWIERKIKIK